MTDLHLIIPPEELVDEWVDEYNRAKVKHHNLVIYIAGKASKWSADVELDACYYWIENYHGTDAADSLQQGRRPKPLSEADQALAMLNDTEVDAIQYDTIRRALERLKKLEESTND